MKLGIIGAGGIARKIGATLLGGVEGVEPYAIAARDIERAQLFAKEFGFSKAYGSYEELLQDKSVDLVYIATPHSHHFQHTMMALEHGKPCLVEKAFTANAREAKELVRIAREKKIFLAEAIWTRYQPMRRTIRDVLESGMIGKPRFLSATLGYQMSTKERIISPDLCGGTMLDLGVYCINFLRMAVDAEPTEVRYTCIKSDTGVDMNDVITLSYPDGFLACLHTSALGRCDNSGSITCERGRIEIENVNNPQHIRVVDGFDNVLMDAPCEKQITGYEYELKACAEALKQGLLESPYMPLDETIHIMEMMDDFRKAEGIVYPMD